MLYAHSVLGRLWAACAQTATSGRSPTPDGRCGRWQTGRRPPPGRTQSAGTPGLQPAAWTDPSSAHRSAPGFSESAAGELDLHKWHSITFISHWLFLIFYNCCISVHAVFAAGMFPDQELIELGMSTFLMVYPNTRCCIICVFCIVILIVLPSAPNLCHWNCLFLLQHQSKFLVAV